MIGVLGLLHCSYTCVLFFLISISQGIIQPQFADDLRGNSHLYKVYKFMVITKTCVTVSTAYSALGHNFNMIMK